MPRTSMKYPLELKLEALDLYEKHGMTYDQIRERFGIPKKARGVVGRLIYEARIHRGERPPEVRKKKERVCYDQDNPTHDPKTKSLLDAYLISQKVAGPYRLSVDRMDSEGSRQNFQAAYKAMTYSIWRECRELKELPPGTVIQTAWDYSDPRVKRYAEKKNLFPSHVTTVYVGRDPDLDDYHHLQER